MELSADRLIEIIKSIHSNSVSQWPLHEPSLSVLEKQRVDECLSSGYVSSVGKFVVQLEHATQKYTGARYAIATINGTSALHIAYLLSGIQPNDEVLTSPLTFIATSNAIRYCQAFPHFVDIEADTFSIDAEKLRAYLLKNTHYENGLTKNRQTGRVIRALAVVHVLGHPGNIQALKDICNDFNLELIEDAAEGLGSTYHEQHVGTFGKAGILSFNGNKIITCGGGGMILTNDEALAQRARHLTTTAKVSHPWEYNHDEVGYNYRMPNLNAALGIAQMERLPLLLSYKRQLATMYAKALEDYRDINFMLEPEHCRSNYWLNAITVKNRQILRDLLYQTSAKNIGVRPLWNLHHSLPIFFDCPRMPITVAEDIVSRTLCLPSSAHTFKLSEVNQTCAG